VQLVRGDEIGDGSLEENDEIDFVCDIIIVTLVKPFQVGTSNEWFQYDSGENLYEPYNCNNTVTCEPLVKVSLIGDNPAYKHTITPWTKIFGFPICHKYIEDHTQNNPPENPSCFDQVVK
jgi:hypothetical protein